MPKISKNAWLYIAILGGCATGLFFGELCSFLSPINDIFIRTMQITIIPYIALSLVTGIGHMTMSELKLVGKKGGLLLLSLWLLGIFMCVAMQFTFPNIINASFYASKEVQQELKLDLIDIFVPTNVFQSLAQGAVPAVVVFCIIFGIALIKEDAEGTVKDFFAAMSGVIERMAKIVMKVVPFAIFSLLAYTAGTISTSQIMTLQVYVITFICVSVFTSFCLLPMVIMLFTGISYKEYITTFSSAIFLGFSTRSSFLAMPLVLEASRELLEKMEMDKKKAAKYTEILLPIAYTFPGINEFFKFIFILFIAWLNKIDIDLLAQFKMVCVGTFLFFGSSNNAVRFLLDMLHLPTDAVSLYISADALLANFDKMTSVTFLIVFTVCGTTLLAKSSKANLKRLIAYTAIVCAIFIGISFSMYNIYTPLVSNVYQGNKIFDSMDISEEYKILSRKMITNIKVYKTHEEVAAIPPRKGDILNDITSSGILRVGYNGDSLPFAFVNKNGDLVGLDVQVAYNLASYLNCHTLEFVNVNNATLSGMLNSGKCDVIMSGLVNSRMLIKDIDCTFPYMKLETAIVVLDARKREFDTAEKISQKKDIKIAISSTWLERELFKIVLPNAEPEMLNDTEDFFKNNTADILLTTAQHGAAWTLRYPTYTMIVPKDEDGRPSYEFAVYAVPKNNSLAWKVFLDEFIVFGKEAGMYEELSNYWIRGKGAKNNEKRWSVIKDVLHWTK